MRHRISLPRRLMHVPVLMALAVAGSTAAFGADKYPQNLAFRIVAPTSPGSPPDVISRLIANEIAGAEGWRFVVENRPGALQTIAMGDVLKQPPDGLSIFPMSTGVVAVPALLPEKVSASKPISRLWPGSPPATSLWSSTRPFRRPRSPSLSRC